jgi:hypothetical protein
MNLNAKQLNQRRLNSIIMKKRFTCNQLYLQQICKIKKRKKIIEEKKTIENSLQTFL